jgi:hypothetical protein
MMAAVSERENNPRKLTGRAQFLPNPDHAQTNPRKPISTKNGEGAGLHSARREPTIRSGKKPNRLPEKLTQTSRKLGGHRWCKRNQEGLPSPTFLFSKDRFRRTLTSELIH